MSDVERYLLLTLLSPILWTQGKYVKRVTPRLPEPDGPREGTSGRGPVLRVLIVGDSAAAGVGAQSQEESLSGQLVNRLCQCNTVQWRVMAVTGLDSPGLARWIENSPALQFDVVLLSIGVNDVTGLMSPSSWVRWQAQLASAINQLFEPKLLIHSAVPPMHAFTALPQPLRWFFGRWAREFNLRLADSLSGNAQQTVHAPFLQATLNGLATDGFHPGPIGYAAWAESLSQLILAADLTKTK